MGNDSSEVLIGKPLVTGGIWCAPLGTALPVNAYSPLDAAFVSLGYVSKEGLKLTPELSTVDITEWGGATVRKLLDTFSGMLSWSMLQFGPTSLRVALGDDNVTTVAANTEHGNLYAAKIGAHLPPRKVWVFEMKDNLHKIRVVDPIGQITSFEEITFATSDAIQVPVQLTTYPDESGENVYIYGDDGLLAAA
jgi:hypothetical protein